jgi:ArsR family transcriptional regulator, arsenate/arsenite/antimonite-responsive transcriptional repressor
MSDSPTPLTETTIAPPPATDTEQRAKLFAALSDPTRLKIVELLATQGELSGSEIATHLGISLALFCHHSKTLAEAGLLQIRRDGQTKYNSLNQDLLLSCFSSFEGLCRGRSEE